MEQNELSRAALGRLPVYLKYLRDQPDEVHHISATVMAKNLGLGEVQVRKDLGAVSSTGRPRIGYQTSELIERLEHKLKVVGGNAIIIGAGKLGKALLDYSGFDDYGISLLAAFDINITRPEDTAKGKELLPMAALPGFCREHDIKIGVIAVPAGVAQEVCNLLYDNGIKAMWCFAEARLYIPADAIIQYENMALSLAQLKMQSLKNI